MHCLFHGSSVGEVADLDHWHFLEIVAFADYTDKRNVSLAGSPVVPHGVTEEDDFLVCMRCGDGSQGI